MMFARVIPWSVFLGMAAMLAGFPSEAFADKPKASNNKKAAAPPPVSPAMKVQQAQFLATAFVTLAAANHDYDGHRANAMSQVKEALKLLDEQVMSNGQKGHKGAIMKTRATVAQAEEAARRLPMLNQPQPASDAKLRQGSAVLQQVLATVGRQPHVKEHVANAIREVSIALTKN